MASSSQWLPRVVPRSFDGELVDVAVSPAAVDSLLGDRFDNAVLVDRLGDFPLACKVRFEQLWFVGSKEFLVSCKPYFM